MQLRIIFPLFMLPLWAYILFMNSRDLESHVLLYTCVCKLFHVPNTVAAFQNTPNARTGPNMIDEFQDRVRPMNDCLCVRIVRREEKPATDKVHQFGRWLREISSSAPWVLLSSVLVGGVFLLHRPPWFLLKKSSVITAPVFYTLPSNWCLINLWLLEVWLALVAPPCNYPTCLWISREKPWLSLKEIKKPKNLKLFV